MGPGRKWEPPLHMHVTPRTLGFIAVALAFGCAGEGNGSGDLANPQSGNRDAGIAKLNENAPGITIVENANAQPGASGEIRALAGSPTSEPGLHSGARSLRQDCVENERRMTGLQGYRQTFLRAGSARVDRETWRTMPREKQHELIWAAAFNASCVEGARRMVQVSIVDENSNLLVRQPVSTSLECHGDRVGSPDDPWYGC